MLFYLNCIFYQYLQRVLDIAKHSLPIYTSAKDSINCYINCFEETIGHLLIMISFSNHQPSLFSQKTTFVSFLNPEHLILKIEALAGLAYIDTYCTAGRHLRYLTV